MNNNNVETVVMERAAVQTAVTMVVKLGLDLHAADVVVCRQDGERLPKPARRMTVEQLLEMVAGLRAAGVRVESCYEAGPCGYLKLIDGHNSPHQVSYGHPATSV